MTDQATRVVPAGWYQDPASAAHVRWWNGLTWTEHVEDKPELPAQPAAASAAAPAVDQEGAARLAEARSMERQFGITTAENAIMTSAATAGVATAGAAADRTPSGSVRTGSTPAGRIRSTSTIGATLLSLVPVFAVSITLVAAYIFLYVKPTPLVGLVGVVFMLLTFLWAVSDKRTLESRGIDGPTPGWALALPFLGALVYLIVRRIRVPGNSHLVIFGILTVLAVGLPLGAAASGAAAAPLKALEVQQAVYADLVDSGRLTGVTCPAFIENTTPGSVFTCDGVEPDGSSTIVWVSIDTPEGGFSWSVSAR